MFNSNYKEIINFIRKQEKAYIILLYRWNMWKIYEYQGIISSINAMTSTDYTTYPVASTNEQDLENLMKVYFKQLYISIW